MVSVANMHTNVYYFWFFIQSTGKGLFGVR